MAFQNKSKLSQLFFEPKIESGLFRRTVGQLFSEDSLQISSAGRNESWARLAWRPNPCFFLACPLLWQILCLGECCLPATSAMSQNLDWRFKKNRSRSNFFTHHKMKASNFKGQLAKYSANIFSKLKAGSPEVEGWPPCPAHSFGESFPGLPSPSLWGLKSGFPADPFSFG